jgi:hypothetical protein
MSEKMHYDRLLQVMIHAADMKDVEQGMILNVGGLIISGILVSIKKYGEGAPVLKDVMKKAGLEAKPAKVFKETEYIHLKDARIFIAGQAPLPVEGMWWRGKISSVDGFSFGTLETNVSNKGG